MTIQHARLNIGGMTCVNCQNKITRRLLKTPGVSSAQVSYTAGTADITYDSDVTTTDKIAEIITSMDYQVLDRDKPASRVGYIAGTLAAIVALFALLNWFGLLNLLVPSQLADATMGYGMLFVIGLLTSVHCVAMCGGINISQSIPKVNGKPAAGLAAFAPSLLYNVGRVVSYTVVGFALGFVGWVIGGGNGSVGIPLLLQGILKLAAGIFMVVMGINMLGIFPWMRRFGLRMPGAIADGVNSAKAGRSPLIVGLLNGLMPCGPLQSMWIVALASGNPLTGALSMLLFSLGTVPLMLGLGSLVSALGKRFAQKVVTVGAILVVVLGLAMMQQGGSLSGLFSRTLARGDSVTPPSTTILTAEATPKPDTPAIPVTEQVITSTLAANRYPNITVIANTPVKWIINVPSGTVNGCNGRMVIPEYGIQHSFKTGENIIEFTPTQTGTFRYSCWMGMIRATITVTN
ncbi:hypothetical protein AGMMS49992_16680 [Clostridia bacterium]|nr:hypothetical protein AGMMS49992_16680 [Clostridia bacterium]